MCSFLTQSSVLIPTNNAYREGNRIAVDQETEEGLYTSLCSAGDGVRERRSESARNQRGKKKKKNQVKFHNEQEVLDLEVSGDVNEEAGGTRNGHYNYTIKHTRVKGERNAVNRE
jgi:hypothetical protein